jgi:hypothetical protein
MPHLRRVSGRARPRLVAAARATTMTFCSAPAARFGRRGQHDARSLDQDTVAHDSGR